MARLGFEARYSGARQYIFESRSRLRDQEHGVRVSVALQVMILSFGAAELTNTGNRASKGTPSGMGGQNAKYLLRANVFRSSVDSGHSGAVESSW